ncbi:hypothetical protein BC629DRAFT_1593451 [Irpex lacteus]|nr:hypothetical protein BC629DRAFT_1593451 [Irpex lacteus]
MPRNPLLEKGDRRGPNPTGKNGSDNGIWPEDNAELHEALLDMAKQQLKTKEKVDLLRRKFGLKIVESTFYKLQKHYDIPTARRMKYSAEVAHQLVLNKMADHVDTMHSRGVARTRDQLAMDGTPVPRDTIREVKRLNEPNTVDARFPGAKRKLRRGRLTGVGPFYEVNCDGHEKLSVMALQMGPVGYDS